MRSIRLVVLSMVVALAPLASAGAQTCQGTAQFREGRARVGAGYQHSSDLDLYSVGAAYGVHDSFYGGASVDQMHPSEGGTSMTGIGATLGYQFHWVATPFQVCPLVTYNLRVGRECEHISPGPRWQYRLSRGSAARLPARSRPSASAGSQRVRTRIWSMWHRTFDGPRRTARWIRRQRTERSVHEFRIGVQQGLVGSPGCAHSVAPATRRPAGPSHSATTSGISRRSVDQHRRRIFHQLLHPDEVEHRLLPVDDPVVVARARCTSSA